LIVPDEGYSRYWSFPMKVIPDIDRSRWRLFQILIVPDEGHSRYWSFLMKVIPDIDRSRWRLFQILIVPDEGHSRYCSFPMTRRAYWFCYLHFYQLKHLFVENHGLSIIWIWYSTRLNQSVIKLYWIQIRIGGAYTTVHYIGLNVLL
jgi:hypothetical protein